MDPDAIRPALRERIAASPDKWFTPNSLAAELEPTDAVDPNVTRADLVAATETVLNELVSQGAVERDGSTYRWHTVGPNSTPVSEPTAPTGIQSSAQPESVDASSDTEREE
jgi:hypothetical protein